MAFSININDSTSPKVYSIHPALLELLPHYRVIRDALSGEIAIKERTTVYLPEPSDEPDSKVNSKRYKDYIKRAVFYNVTKRTLNGLIGQVFIKPPVFKLPTSLAIMEKDASVDGLSLTQASKKSLALTLSYSRSGLFVDFPYVEGDVSKLQVAKGYIKPTISIFSPEQVVNWRTRRKGAKEVLSMVCIYETYDLRDDGFEIKTAEQYRVLRLDSEGYYYQEVWRRVEDTSEKSTSPLNKSRETKVNYDGNFSDSFIDNYKWDVHEFFYPTDYNGNRLEEIPFTFIGSQNNDINPDSPNFYDLASLNIAHYRNSADYEEGVFLSGQPTIVAAGLDEQWVKDVLQGKLLVGSRGGIPLPKGGQAKLLQASDQMTALAAMEHKERQMVALGAKLVEQRKTERTAFEVKLEATADGSVLSNTANNVSDAYVKALEWCGLFVGNTEPIEFKLNIEYDLVRMTSDDLQQLVATWQEGAISFKEMRDKLREGGYADEPDDKVLKEVEERKKKDIQMQRQQFAADQQNKPNINIDNTRGNN